MEKSDAHSWLTWLKMMHVFWNCWIWKVYSQKMPFLYVATRCKSSKNSLYMKYELKTLYWPKAAKSSQKSDSCCTQLKETEFSSTHEICFPKENGQRSLNHLSSSTYPHQQGLTNWQWYTGLPSTCELYCVLQGPCGALNLTKSRVPSCKTDPLANSEFDPQEQHGNTYASDLLFAVYLIPVSISLQLLSRRSHQEALKKC